MLQFWRNPELVRHLRAELRPARALMVAAVVLFVAALIGLASWSQHQEMLASAEQNAQRVGGQWVAYAQNLRAESSRQTWLVLCQWLLGLQAGLVTFWALFMCAQSVSGERDRKTWDFQRTTSLTAAEIMIGKVLGEPILAYFAALCVLPITFWAGVAGGIPFWSLLLAYIGLIAGTLFLGLSGIWVSTLLESRSRGVGLIGALFLYGLTLGTYGFASSWFPGLAAFSPLTALHTILGMRFDGGRDVTPMLFGHAVPWVLVSLILYASFGAWIVVMILRNLKRDYSEVRPLSRWQAVGCVGFINFIFYALFSWTSSKLESDDLATFMVALNGAILFLIGLGSLTPHERLKVWWRGRTGGTSSIFSEQGLPWPWLVMSATVAYALLAWGLMTWRSSLYFHARSLRAAALEMLVILIFILRDILFIQWCTLTRLRQPVLKGILFLCLYYGSAGVVIAMASVSGDAASVGAMNLLTPFGVFDRRTEWGHSAISTYAGMALQIGLIAVILMAIGNRLGRSSLAPAVSES